MVQEEEEEVDEFRQVRRTQFHEGVGGEEGGNQRRGKGRNAIMTEVVDYAWISYERERGRERERVSALHML